MKQYVTNFTNLTINKLDKSDKSSNTLQVGQIKHCNQFPWGLLYLCTFFLLSMRFCLGKKRRRKLKKVFHTFEDPLPSLYWWASESLL